jgi:hypothetical protein
MARPDTSGSLPIEGGYLHLHWKGMQNIEKVR